MLHLNIPDGLEGHVFQNLGEQGLKRSLWHTLGMGQELHLWVLCQLIQLPHLQHPDQAAPNTTFEQADLSKHLPGRWGRTPPIWFPREGIHVGLLSGIVPFRSSMVLQYSHFNAHHSRPSTPSQPVSEVNSLVKYFIYSLNSQPRADLCTGAGGKRPSLRDEDLKVTAEGVRQCSSRIKYKLDTHWTGCTVRD